MMSKLLSRWKNRKRDSAAQIWAIDPSEYPAAVESMSSMHSGEGDGVSYSIEGDTARISVEGYIHPGLLQALETSVDAACDDPSVRQIVMHIDSPGGYATGVASTASYLASSAKPISTVVSGQCASAAYWLASATGEISAYADASVGSIGVFSVARDMSVMFSEHGIQTHVFRTHELKGIGVPGAPITDAQQAELQRRTDECMGQFAGAVRAYRGLSDEALAEASTGQCWLADGALKKNLIDRVVHHKRANMSEASSTPPQVAASDTLIAERDSALAFAREQIVVRGMQTGRILPAQADTWRRLGRTYSAAELQAFADSVDALPMAQAVHPIPLGSSHQPAQADADPMDSIRALARKIVSEESASGRRVTESEAINRVCSEHPELYFLATRGGK